MIFVNMKINNAVITVPVYFNDLQRQSTKNAGIITELDIFRIINEPTVASIVYNLDINKNIKEEKNILVFDFGGGNLDITILLLFENIYEVIFIFCNSHFRRSRFR